MVQVCAVSWLLLLASSAVAVVNDRTADGHDLARGIRMGDSHVGGFDGRGDCSRSNLPPAAYLDLDERRTLSTRLPQSREAPIPLLEEPKGFSPVEVPNNEYFGKRQHGNGKREEEDGSSPDAPAQSADPDETTLGPLASSVSVSLTSSAASALASISASFRGQISALSSQSSADLAAASAAASASASSVIASVTASAASAGASASASAAASAMSAVAAAKASLASATSMTMPSATAVSETDRPWDMEQIVLTTRNRMPTITSSSRTL